MLIFVHENYQIILDSNHKYCFAAQKFTLNFSNSNSPKINFTLEINLPSIIFVPKLNCFFSKFFPYFRCQVIYHKG